MISFSSGERTRNSPKPLKSNGCRTVYTELQNLMIAETFGKM